MRGLPDEGGADSDAAGTPLQLALQFQCYTLQVHPVLAFRNCGCSTLLWLL